jgi:hypothetical protein
MNRWVYFPDPVSIIKEKPSPVRVKALKAMRQSTFGYV